MNMTSILALADLTRSGLGSGPPSERQPTRRLEEAATSLDALVAYLDAICLEWVTTPEADRLAAAGLAAETARKIRALLGPIAGCDRR
jgi:hypothetical protein